MYIKYSVESILRQSYSEFELLVLDDASSDGTSQILSNLALQDSRIKLYSNAKNLGIIPTRNKLLAIANAEFVAFMDADDICLPERFSCQLDFMLNNPEIAAVGTGYETISSNKKVYIPPQTHQKIMSNMYLNNVMCNPSMMLRLKAIRQLNVDCDIAYQGAADYDMWLRLGQKAQLANIPKVLLQYRKHSSQESCANVDRQKKAHLNILHREFVARNMTFHQEHISALAWYSVENYRSVGKAYRLDHYVSYIVSHKNKFENPDDFELVWDIRFKGICRRLGWLGLVSYIFSRGTNLFRGKNFGTSFVYDCLFRRNAT